MTRHRYFVWLGVLCASLLSTTQTQARTQPTLDSGQLKVSQGAVLMDQKGLERMARRYGLKIKTIKLPKHEIEKLASLASKNCGCVMTDEEEFGGGGWKCFRDCLAAANVNYATITACAAVCGATLIGCAICVGVGEWIVMGCSLACTWAPLFSKNVEPAIRLAPKLRPSETQRNYVAKHTVRGYAASSH